MPSAFPSRAQVEMLLKHLEERRWLTARHSRTLHARDRTRAAWQEVAAKLNSDRSGCIKSWKQWSKYWMDKKSAVKKKATQTRMARQQTGGGEPEEGFLSALEEKILAIMDGKNFVTGDKKLENGLHVANEPGPSVDLTADVPNADESDDVFLIIQDVKEEANATPGSESIHEIHLQLLPVEQTSTGMPQTEQSKPSIPELQPGPSWQYTNMPMENQPNTEQMFEPRSPPAVPHKSNAPITSSFSLTGYWLCNSLIHNFLRPYRRLKDTQQRQELMDSVNLELQYSNKTPLRSESPLRSGVRHEDENQPSPQTEPVTQTEPHSDTTRKGHLRSHKRKTKMRRHRIHRYSPEYSQIYYQEHILGSVTARTSVQSRYRVKMQET